MARGWLIGFHLIGVVLWMGGLMAFSRILGYHSKELPSARPRFTFIEGRLNWLVAVPGAVLTVAFGLWLAIDHGMAWFRVASWMHWKLTLVLAVVVIHTVLTVKHGQIRRAHPAEPMSRGLYAALHGTVGLLLIAIVLLATTQPMSQR
ncbi:MAG: rane protein [Myxococcales bacterium]|nr:rane protein [Myxococcales bacterium]